MERHAPEVTGRGFDELSFVSTYASPNGLLRHWMTGMMFSFGVNASASGRMYPVARSTVCANRSCSSTMKPVSMLVTLPMMNCQFCST